MKNKYVYFKYTTIGKGFCRFSIDFRVVAIISGSQYVGWPWQSNFKNTGGILCMILTKSPKTVCEWGSNKNWPSFV